MSASGNDKPTHLHNMLDRPQNGEPLAWTRMQGSSHGGTMLELWYAERADDMHTDPKQPLRMRMESQSGRDHIEHEEAPSRCQSGLSAWIQVRRSCF